MIKVDFSNFEKKAGIIFTNKELLKQAFVHRSYINENRNANVGHNERLEFLGDAVLELIVTRFLYEKYPERTEGDLTAYRSALVNAVTLGTLAEQLGMNDFLLLSRGEAKDKGRGRQVILANTMEAFIGALYIDQGYDAAQDFVAKNLFPLTDKIVENKTWLDAKSHFQEKSQEVFGVTPIYKTLFETGPDHDKHFTVGVFLDNVQVALGDGKSKQEAEQDAAQKGLVTKGWN